MRWRRGLTRRGYAEFLQVTRHPGQREMALTGSRYDLGFCFVFRHFILKDVIGDFFLRVGEGVVQRLEGG